MAYSRGKEVRSFHPSPELSKHAHRASEILGFEPPILLDYRNLELNTYPSHRLVKSIENVIRSFEPTRIFTHHPGDLNSDHIFVSSAASAASRLFQRCTGYSTPNSLYFLEISSSTDWNIPINSTPFYPQIFFDVAHTIELKKKALEAYQGVLRDPPHPRSHRSLDSLATLRGHKAVLCMLNPSK